MKIIKLFTQIFIVLCPNRIKQNIQSYNLLTCC